MKPLDAASSNQLVPVLYSASAYGAPLVAKEVALTVYCSVAVFTVSYAGPKLPNNLTDSTFQAFVWTWALCVPEEVEIVNRKWFSMPVVIYFVTRWV